MDPIITPALILLGLLAVHSKTGGNPGAIGEKSAAEPNDAPEDAGPEEIEFSPEWRHAALDMRADGAQSFKPRVASAIERGLSNASLERVAVDGAETSALVFRVVPGAGDLSVAKAVQIGREKKLAVLATLAITIPDTTAERYVMLCKVSEISMAARGTNLAVLSEPAAAKVAHAVGDASSSDRLRSTSGDGARPPSPLAGETVTVAGSAVEPVKSPLAESVPPAKAEKPKRAKKAKAPKAEIVAVAAPTEPLNGMNHKPRNAEKSENVDELPVR